jgi:hypothetical protein
MAKFLLPRNKNAYFHQCAPIRLSEVNESCPAADNSALQLLIAISSLKFLFTVSSKDRKICAKNETMRQYKNEPYKKKTLLERGGKKEWAFLKVLSLFSEHPGDSFLNSDMLCSF